MKKKLLIIDLENNYNLKKKNFDVVHLSTGSVVLEECKTIKLSNIKNQNHRDFKKNFYSNLEKYLFSTCNKHDTEFFLETEICNIRNDKSDLFDKIYYINSIKNIIKNYDFVEVLYDNKNLTNTFNSLDKTKVNLNLVSNNNIREFSYTFFLLRRLKFFIRAFLLTLFVKFLPKKNEIYKENIALSIYPLLFHNKEIGIYNGDNQYLNFSITDETHLHQSLISKCKNLIYLNSDKKFIITEKNILLIDLIKNFIITFPILIDLYHFKKKIFKINNVDYSNLIFQHLVISLLNRLKLEIYKRSIKYIFKNKNIKNFKYFLFEYNFGFFLNNQINKVNKNINYIGYQHGIFSKNLFWFDFVKKFKKFNIYPDEIIANNKYSLNDYKEILKNKVKKYKFYKNKKNNLKNFQISKNSKNYLLVLGQHDHDHILRIFKNKRFDKNFFIKPHPRSKKIILNNYKNIKIYQKKIKFKKILFSQTTTVYYDWINTKRSKNFMLIGFDYKKNITFDLFKKKDYFYLN